MSRIRSTAAAARAREELQGMPQVNSRKQSVSIRMSSADVRSVKRLARRLGVRDSDVIRLAVKVMLAKLGPLNDPGVRGRSLVPVFVESGADLFRYLELDALRLESIINDGVGDDARVEADDIQLIAMNGIQQSYAKLRLSSLAERNGGGRSDAAGTQSGEDSLATTLRQYLYGKYVFKAPLPDPGGAD